MVEFAADTAGTYYYRCKMIKGGETVYSDVFQLHVTPKPPTAAIAGVIVEATTTTRTYEYVPQPPTAAIAGDDL